MRCAMWKHNSAMLWLRQARAPPTGADTRGLCTAVSEHVTLKRLVLVQLAAVSVRVLFPPSSPSTASAGFSFSIYRDVIVRLAFGHRGGPCLGSSPQNTCT